MHERQTPKGSSSGTFNTSSGNQPRPHAQSGSSGASSGQSLEQLLSQAAEQSQAANQSHPSGHASTGSQSPAASLGGSSSSSKPGFSFPFILGIAAVLLFGVFGGGCSVLGSGLGAGSSGYDANYSADTNNGYDTSYTSNNEANTGSGYGYAASSPTTSDSGTTSAADPFGLSSLFGFDFSGSGGYGSSYDSSQYTSAYQVDSDLGAGNDSDTWTVLMYLCGSDLESTPARRGGGQATNNLVELSKAKLGANVNFVVETGGAKAWQNDVVNPRYLSRYLIKDGKMALQDQQASASMAKESTFADFLSWGVSNFPADRYMVVIWDHGGGSITGVCQDDLYPYDNKGQADSLTLPEMRNAMQKAGVKFDVVGFDTCLMATVETAQILSPYANYMVASEESEPGAGWDYKAWPSWLAAHPGTSGADLGTIICQTYYDKCASYRQQGMATLSVIDLSKVGKVSQAFQDASDDIALATVEPTSLRRLQQGAKSAERYGDSGFFSMNMVDLADLMTKTSAVVGSDAKAVIQAINEAIVYEVHGRNRASAKGLSVYYPIQIMDRRDFARYAEVTDNTPYLQFLAVMFGVYDNYQWNKFDNYVSLHGEPVADKDVKIKYKQGLNNSGHVQLDITQGADQVAHVAYEMYVYLDQLGILCYLGSDNDLNGSYEKGTFVENFQDDWLTIDGHYVSASLCEVGDGYNLYYIPILLNDEQTGLIVEYEFSTNEYNVLCVWDEANQATGMAGKTGRLLEEGDKVQFLFPAENAKTGINDVIPLETMTWHEDAKVVYEKLGDGNFAFRYEITDVLGNKIDTDLVYQRYKNGRVVK